MLLFSGLRWSGCDDHFIKLNSPISSGNADNFFFTLSQRPGSFSLSSNKRCCLLLCSFLMQTYPLLWGGSVPPLTLLLFVHYCPVVHYQLRCMLQQGHVDCLHRKCGDMEKSGSDVFISSSTVLTP
jgi:hypothetical protein